MYYPMRPGALIARWLAEKRMREDQKRTSEAMLRAMATGSPRLLPPGSFETFDAPLPDAPPRSLEIGTPRMIPANQQRAIAAPPNDVRTRSNQADKIEKEREVIECTEKQAFNLQRMADPSDVEQIVQDALDRTTPDQVRRGTAGNNVDQNQQFVLTDDGIVDLKHVVSAGNNRFSNYGLGAAAGLKVEFDQLLRRSPSAFAREDLFSNTIGQHARIRANIFPNLTFARAVQTNIDALGGVKPKNAPVCAK